MLRDPATNENTRVMHNTRDYFIHERGTTYPVSRETIERRFGKMIHNLTLDYPFTWIDLDDDPRAEAAANVNVRIREYNAKVIDLVNDAMRRPQ